MWQNAMDDEGQYTPRAERISFDMLVRYRHNGRRATVLLKNLTLGGARIEGMADLRYGDTITLLLPSLKAKEATVVWAVGQGVGLEFDRPLHPDVFESLVFNYARPRERNDVDRAQPVPHRDTGEVFPGVRHAA